MKPQLEADDFTLVDRMAAAFMRNDIECARELVAAERVRWQRQGADMEIESARKATEIQWEFEKRCNAWFETKDGLRVKDKISGGDFMPYAWKRACRSKMPTLIVDENFWSTNPTALESREVRTYERDGTDRDGLPIYREI